jgi:hypothetical protein
MVRSSLCLFPLGFLTKTLYTPLFFPVHATYPAYLTPLDLIILIKFGMEWKLWSSWLQFCPFSCHLRSLRSKHSPLAPCSWTPSVCVKASITTNYLLFGWNISQVNCIFGGLSG